jgi:hypothetical protein
MTQMLLFDAPVGIADSARLPVADYGADCGDAMKSTDCRSAIDSQPHPTLTECSSDRGLHHMGDLARLVLLRYDLMAKRRAEFAARRRAR